MGIYSAGIHAIVFLVGFFLQLIFSVIPVHFWWSTTAPHIWYHLFVLYPPFNFAKCLADFALKAFPHFDLAEGGFVSGPGYKTADLFSPVLVEKLYGNRDFYAPPTAWSMVFLALNSLALFLTAVVLDVAWSDPERMWRLLRLLGSEFRPRRRRAAAPPAHMLVVSRASKHYGPAWLRSARAHLSRCLPSYCSRILLAPPPPPAVDRLSVSATSGSVLCLLGHNGAGKTTTVGMITAAMPPSSGEISVCGFDVAEHPDEIHSIVGLCPQHDLLWDELSPYEHLMVFAGMKGIVLDPSAMLSSVGLSEVAHSPSKMLSGGMKRRLSVAICSIGSPRVLVFDEPTTGLDPIHKRHVWQLISDLKRDRIVILTTHCMEEAAYLSDQIAILSSGRLLVLGNPLSLRNKHGVGYRLNIQIPPQFEGALVTMFESSFFGFEMVAASAGSVTFSFRSEAMTLFPSVLQKLQSDFPVRSMSLSFNTLEEVFFKVTNESVKHDSST
eukprot:TRINITY_DN1030_c0_g1_i4.p1 TRINITY_DN1030_c0_g1~~TRINITY_DN1030_c0_g1_i4.p1  ORF type:complete len:497 (+),score=82.74 TRINITY_DN1030_c0_g1_i4:512-2002(+)